MSAGAPEDEGFLSRWSRRKREPVAPEIRNEAPAPAVDKPQGGSPATPPVEDAEPELVEPPSLDLVDKDFDLVPWLKQNVPESWKLAALRRAWESDPAIAGFENPARDYALDWNTPGGAPGYGPLTESDDVGAMVRAIFGEKSEADAPAEQADEAAGDAGGYQLSSNDEAVKIDDAAQEKASLQSMSAAVRLSDEAESADETGAGAVATPPQVYAAVQNNQTQSQPSVRIRKRGGGAIPI